MTPSKSVCGYPLRRAASHPYTILSRRNPGQGRPCNDTEDLQPPSRWCGRDRIRVDAGILDDAGLDEWAIAQGTLGDFFAVKSF